jgi:Polyketide cyclase / dehydrase and lipid transport
MASIHKQVAVDVDAKTAWQSLRQIENAHELFEPVLTSCRLEGGMRIVQFANGMVVREHILDVDEGRRRVAYAALDVPGMTYHHASMQVVEEGPGRCRFVWVTDFMPEEVGARIAPLIEQGAAAFKRHVEKR